MLLYGRRSCGHQKLQWHDKIASDKLNIQPDHFKDLARNQSGWCLMCTVTMSLRDFPWWWYGTSEWFRPQVLESWHLWQIEHGWVKHRTMMIYIRKIRAALNYSSAAMVPKSHLPVGDFTAPRDSLDTRTIPSCLNPFVSLKRYKGDVVRPMREPLELFPPCLYEFWKMRLSRIDFCLWLQLNS